MNNTQKIELDCSPFAPRPDTLLAFAIRETPLEIVPPLSKMLGCWEFDYSHIDAQTWEESQNKLRENITLLFKQGSIRYGSWSSPQ